MINRQKTLTISHQQGSMLLEALIGILIFSLGIIGLIGLQAASIKSTSESRYRADAAALADKLIAQMWVDQRATIATAYASPGGNRFTTWYNNIISPSGSAIPLLPGAAVPANRPTVTFVTNPATSSITATVTVFWQSPGGPQRQYVTVAQIGKND